MPCCRKKDTGLGGHGYIEPEIKRTRAARKPRLQWLPLRPVGIHMAAEPREGERERECHWQGPRCFMFQPRSRSFLSLWSPSDSLCESPRCPGCGFSTSKGAGGKAGGSGMTSGRLADVCAVNCTPYKMESAPPASEAERMVGRCKQAASALQPICPRGVVFASKSGCVIYLDESVLQVFAPFKDGEAPYGPHDGRVF